MASTSAPRTRAPSLRTSCFILLKASLPLSVSSGHISWMTPKGAEDGSRMLAAGDGSRGIAPRPLWSPRPLIEIGDQSRYVGSRRRGAPRAERKASYGGGHGQGLG